MRIFGKNSRTDKRGIKKARKIINTTPHGMKATTDVNGIPSDGHGQIKAENKQQHRFRPSSKADNVPTGGNGQIKAENKQQHRFRPSRKDGTKHRIKAKTPSSVPRERVKQNRQQTRTFLKLRILSDCLFLCSAITLLPCLLCLFYPPVDVFSILPIVGLSVKSIFGALAALLALVILSIFLLITGLSARFTSLCVYMYKPNEGLTPPWNMLTLKNGLRYGAFCLWYGAIRLFDATRFFLPFMISILLMLTGIRYGLTKAETIHVLSATAAAFLLGTAFYAYTGKGRYRGTCTLYLSVLASTRTAVQSSRTQTLSNKEVFLRELTLFPFMLLCIVPIIRFAARFYVRKRRLSFAVTELKYTS